MSLPYQSSVGKDHDESTSYRVSSRPGAAQRDPFYRDQPFLPVYHRQWANPSPLAFSALASALYVLSMVLLGADGLKSLSILNIVTLGYSAIALAIAGIWEFPAGNTWAATVYLALAGFWASLGMLLTDTWGITSSYTSTVELDAAIAQFFYSWLITLVVFTIGALRSSGGLLAFLVLVDCTVGLIGTYYSFGKPVLATAAGSFGIVAAFVAWYACVASLLTQESAGFKLPVLIDLRHSRGREMQRNL